MVGLVEVELQGPVMVGILMGWKGRSVLMNV